MPHIYDSVPWDEPGWRQLCQGWILEQLDRLSLQLSEEIQEVHRRPWSTVLRVPTSSGDLYFKASNPSLIHEARLTQALATWRPELLPAVTGVEPERCWLLLEDGGGRTLRSFLGSAEYLAFWRQVLPVYARLQIELAERQQELLRLGAMDRRLSTLPAQFKKLLEDRKAMLIDEPEGLSTRQYHALVDFIPTFSDMCSRLNGYGLPETIQHDDFHGNNIFVTDSGFKFFDWGETCVAHPFFTMTVTLRGIAYYLKIEEDAPEILGLRYIYLRTWMEATGLPDLEEALQLAIQVGMVNRSLTWHKAVSNLPEPYWSQEADGVTGGLLRFLEAVVNNR